MQHESVTKVDLDLSTKKVYIYYLVLNTFKFEPLGTRPERSAVKTGPMTTIRILTTLKKSRCSSPPIVCCYRPSFVATGRLLSSASPIVNKYVAKIK